MTTGALTSVKTGSTHVSFLCQKCGQPLKLDDTFNTLDEAMLTELSAPATKGEAENTVESSETHTEEELNSEGDDDVHRQTIPTVRLLSSTSSGNGFMLLGESMAPPMENLSHKLKVMSYLFDILSGLSEVDHPLCQECTDTLLNELDHQLEITEEQCKDYSEFYETLQQESSSPSVTDEGALDAELTELLAEEELLRQQLESIEGQRRQVGEEMETEVEEERKLEEAEERYWQEYNEYKRQLLEYEDAQRSVDNQLKYEKAQLEKLKKTNVFNATFHIWHSGHFGTINNFRLGRLPSVPVEWPEINAAWGQTVLLLNALAKKMNITFQRYRLVPYGNHSFLESLSDKSKELPLYCTGGIRFFWDTKFDQAMVAFLDCLQQFKEEVEKGDAGFCLPYRMERGKVEDTSSGNSYNIKIQFNSEEQWTKALKFMLTNLKWALAWVASQFANK